MIYDETLEKKWITKLWQFTEKHRRPATRFEWNWMRYQFEIEHMQTEQEDSPLALAADGDTVRVGIQRIEQYQERKFTGVLNGHTYTITITPRKVKDNFIIYIKGVDEKNNNANNIRIKLCNVVIELNERGRCQMSLEEYRNEILKSLGLEISMDGRNYHELTPEI